MTGVLALLLFGLVLGHPFCHAAPQDFDSDNGDSFHARDSYDWSPVARDQKQSALEPTFDDKPGDSLDVESNKLPTSSSWNSDSSDATSDKNHEEADQSSTESPRKNVFIYVPFRASDSRNKQRALPNPPSTTTSTTTTPKPSVPRGQPTARTTFSSAWPPADSPSLRSISRSSSDHKGLEKWRPVSGLKESASSSFYTQAAAPIVQSPTQIPLSAPTLLFAPPPAFSVAAQPLVAAPPVHDVRIVQAPAVQQAPPVQVSVVQAPVAAPPVHLDIVRAPPQPEPVHVDFLRSPPQALVQQQFIQAPLLQQRLVQAAPVHTHFVQSPVIHAQPVLQAAPVLRTAVLHSPPVAAPPCPTPVFQPHFHAVPHTFFSPPLAQRTRTVLQQVQFVPDQTHVFTTTSYSPATRTTVYDQVAAYSSPKAHVVRAPALRATGGPERDGPATIYTFPKMRILGAPFRLAGRLSSRRLLRQRLREERRKEKSHTEKGKKILVFN